MLCYPYCSYSCQQYCSALLHLIARADSGSTMLNNIVDNYAQCGEHNIVASPVFNNLEQVIFFKRVQFVSDTTCYTQRHVIYNVHGRIR